MSHIKVKAIDQNIIFTDSPRIYSGDINTDTIEFSFDEVWNGYIKTAVFYKDINTPYFQLLKNNSCVIPREVLSEAGKINVGVFGVLNDKVITSEMVIYEIGQGAITLVEYQPSPDIWRQILAELGNIRETTETIKQNETNFIDSQKIAFEQLKQDNQSFKTETKKNFDDYYNKLKEISANFMTVEDVDAICGGNYDPSYDDYNADALTEEEILKILV